MNQNVMFRESARLLAVGNLLQFIAENYPQLQEEFSKAMGGAVVEIQRPDESSKYIEIVLSLPKGEKLSRASIEPFIERAKVLFNGDVLTKGTSLETLLVRLREMAVEFPSTTIEQMPLIEADNVSLENYEEVSNHELGDINYFGFYVVVGL